MLTVTAFARHGHVSLTTLAQLASAGALVPAAADLDGRPAYDGRQLRTLNHVLADRAVDQAEATWRRALLTQDHRVLVEETALPSVPVLQAATTVADPTQIDAAIIPLFARLARGLRAAGIEQRTPTTAWYDDAVPGEGVLRLGTAYPLTDGFRPDLLSSAGLEVATLEVATLEVATLEAEPRVATTLHHGPMEGIIGTWQALQLHLAEQGLRPTGRCREVYLHKPRGRQPEWVTQLQQPVAT